MSRAVTGLTALEEAPWRFDFFSALKTVESAYPDSPPFGLSQHLKDDPIRLRQYVSLAFEPAMVKHFIREQGKSPQLEVTFLGLTGPNAPMPVQMSEEALARKLNQKDPSLAHFLDIFHHRLLSVLYRSWAQARYGRCLTRYKSALNGTLYQPEKMPMSGYFSREFIEQRRSAQGLRCLVWQAFELIAEVLTLRRSWLNLPQKEHTRLGVCRFDKGIILGRRVCSAQHHFILTLHPATFSDYQRCLPEHPQFNELIYLVRRYAGENMSWKLIVKLPASQRPHFRLGGSLSLGRNTWLGKRDKYSQFQDCVFTAVRFYS